MAEDISAPVDVTIRIDRAHAQRMDEIVQALESLGLGRIERHDRFSIINGSIRADLIDPLRSVTGVASVRQDRTYRTI